MNSMIPDEAVEAVAHVLQTKGPSRGYLGDARQLLEAAAPHMLDTEWLNEKLAQTWQAGWNGWPQQDVNPYR